MCVCFLLWQNCCGPSHDQILHKLGYSLDILDRLVEQMWVPVHLSFGPGLVWMRGDLGGGLKKEESRSEWRHFVWFSVQQGTIWELQSLCKGQGRQSSNYCVGVCSRCSGISSNADSSLLPSLRPKYLWSTYLVRKRIIGIMHCEGQLWHISYIISCSYLSPEKVLSHLSLFPHCVIR